MIRKTFLLLCCFSLCSAAPPAEKLTGYWPAWRGPNRDGLSADTGLIDDWDANPPKLLWSTGGLGSGFASIAIAGGRIYTVGDRGPNQYLFARNLASGEPLWEAIVGPAGGISYPGSRGTPAVNGDTVYVIGSRGDVAAVRAANGETIWRRHLVRDFGGRMMSGWGFSESPLIDGDQLLCTPGSADAAIVAMDKHNGSEIWRAAIPALGPNGGNGAGYSSIVVSRARGVRQYVQLIGRGIISVAAADGRFLWSYNRVANGTANIPTPIVRGDYVFCSTGYGAGAALLQVLGGADRLDVDEVYFLPGRTFQNHHGGMLLVGDYVYCGTGHNNGFPICIELQSGQVAWSPGRGPGSGSAAVTYADGHVYFRYENGVMALIEATPDAYRLKGAFKIPGATPPSWAHPVVTGGKLYLRKQDALLCYSLRADPQSS